MSDWTKLPGYVSHTDGPDMPTVTVERERIVSACTYARDAFGFDMCVDVVATDYLSWGGKGVAGYIGAGSSSIAAGRDLNRPMTQGLEALPAPKPKRFSLSYHLLKLGPEPRRVRLQTWVDDGEPVPSVVSVWPTADWHEREQFDLMGITFDGHPNLVRILLEDDW